MARELVDQLLRHVRGLLSAGAAAEALPLGQRAVRADPANANAWFLLGRCHRLLNDFAAAVEALKNADLLDPNQPEILLTLGIAQQLNDELDQAELSLRRAIMLDPNFTVAYNSLGITLRKLGRLHEALQTYDSGLEALGRNLSLQLVNEPGGPIYKEFYTRFNLWLNLAMGVALTLVAHASEVEGLAWPTEEMAEEESRTRKHGGLMWVDLTEAPVTRLFLPNYFNYFAQSLRPPSVYPHFMANRATVLGQLGHTDEESESVAEAEDFGGESIYASTFSWNRYG